MASARKTCCGLVASILPLPMRMSTIVGGWGSSVGLWHDYVSLFVPHEVKQPRMIEVAYGRPLALNFEARSPQIPPQRRGEGGELLSKLFYFNSPGGEIGRRKGLKILFTAR